MPAAEEEFVKSGVLIGEKSHVAAVSGKQGGEKDSFS
jgi:hypothetical protein